MTKEFLARQASYFSGEKITSKTIDAVISAIIGGVKSGDKVELRGFGTFCMKQSKERIARNVTTGEKVVVHPRNEMKFRPSKVLFDELNK